MTAARIGCYSHVFTAGAEATGASWQAHSSETRNCRPARAEAPPQQRAGAVTPAGRTVMSPRRAAQRSPLGRGDRQGLEWERFHWNLRSYLAPARASVESLWR